MSTLRSGIDELRGQDLSFLGDAELDDRLREIARCTRGLAVESARTVAEIERRGSFGASGHLSVTSFVETRLGVGWAEAAREVRLARALEEMPAVREAMAAGELSPSAAATLAGARESAPEAYSRAEASLLDAACSLPARGLRHAIDRWRAEADVDRLVLDEAERHERRELHARPDSDGMVVLGARLDVETGATVTTALQAVVDSWVRAGVPEDRSPAQMMADALGEICRWWLDRTDRPEVGTERPHLTVVVDVATLERRTGVAELDGAGAVSAETARRLACDAVVSRVITSGRSEPLEAGRSTRVVPPSMRRALVVRDRGCAFPVCDRPASWCDAHHVKHWAEGGPTDLANLVLLCRRHHRMIHAGFAVRIEGGRPAFRRPDGSPIADRAPP